MLLQEAKAEEKRAREEEKKKKLEQKQAERDAKEQERKRLKAEAAAAEEVQQLSRCSFVFLAWCFRSCFWVHLVGPRPMLTLLQVESKPRIKCETFLVVFCGSTVVCVFF